MLTLWSEDEKGTMVSDIREWKWCYVLYVVRYLITGLFQGLSVVLNLVLIT